MYSKSLTSLQISTERSSCKILVDNLATSDTIKPSTTKKELFMKSIKVLICATALVFSFSASATGTEGVEELCHQLAETNVTLKHAMKEDAGFLQYALDDAAKSKISADSKAQLRERYFYVHNRLNLSDTDMRRLSLVACLLKYK